MEALSNLGVDLRGFLVYLINFGILVFILAKFVYKPLVKFLDERRENISQNLHDAEAMRQKFAQEVEKHEQEREQLIKKMEAEVTKVRKQTELESLKMLAQAEAHKEKILAETTAQMEAKKAALEQEIKQDIIARMEKALVNILQQRVPTEVIRQSSVDAWQEVSKKR